MRGDFEVRGLSGIIANTRAFDADAQREIRGAVKRGAEETVDLTQQFCAYDTGFMHDHVGYELSPEGLTYKVGWKAEDFAAAGKEFYPPYVELGTSTSPAQPALFPAHEIMRPIVQQDIGDAVRRSIARVGR
jgi:hypothetical protein